MQQIKCMKCGYVSNRNAKFCPYGCGPLTAGTDRKRRYGIISGLLLASLLALVLAAVSLLENEKIQSTLEWQFGYDDASRITRITAPGGRETRILYKDDNVGRIRRLVKDSSVEPSVDYEYDEFGRCVSMSDSLGIVRYEYDSFDHLITVHPHYGSPIRYTYDTMDRLSSVSLGDDLTIRYYYDFLGRLDRISTPVGDISYEYQTGQGVVICELPNGIKTISEYRPDDKLASITHLTKDNAIVAKYTYQYIPDGLIGEIREISPSGERILSYEYDKVQRLASVADSQGDKISYSYDDFGNMTEIVTSVGQTIVYDWAGRMVKYNDNECKYDPVGNLEEYVGKHGKSSFEYTGLDLIKAASTNRGKVKYRYDGDGRLVARTTDGGETTFIPDPTADIWKPLLEMGAGGEKKLYVWAGDTPLIVISGGKADFLLHDHLGSVRCVSDRGGEIVKRLDYSPFGVPKQEHDDNKLQPGFAGLFYEPSASLYLTGSRSYDPNLGRFLQRDPEQRIPLGTQKNLSAYAYCGCDPINFTDNGGAQAKWVWGPENWLWQIANNPLQIFDASAAKEIYAQAAEHHIKNAGGLGICAGLTAFAFDLVGGYIPGESSRWQQNAAGIAWSLATGLRFGLPSTSFAVSLLRGTSAARSAASFSLNIGAGKIGDALLNLFSLGGSAAGLRTDIIQQATYFDNAGQGTFYFLYPNLERLATNLQRVSDFVRGFDIGRRLPDAGKYIGYGIYETYDLLTPGGAPENVAGIPSGDSNITQRPNVRWLPSDRDPFQPPREFVRAQAISRELDRQEAISSELDRQETISRELDRYEAISQELDRWEAINGALDEGEQRKKFFPPPPDDGNGGGGGGAVSFGPGGPGGGGGGGDGGDGGPPGPLGPSNVGGVYLRGAGEAIRDLGSLVGIAIDEDNGRLVLISEEKGEVQLPPLRLEDIVTVFRCVYDGDAPYVSIDPNPKDPNGPIMLVRLGSVIDKTYVGWVLFESDRVMKCYSLGRDNITREQVNTQIPGYQNLFDLGFSDFSNGRVWERFWIVPAEVKRFRSGDENLTLLDVQLKVKTQRMEMRGGELVPASDDRSSESAETFSKWFTDHYNDISQERTSIPPTGSGVSSQVAFYEELRRIALITAIAENLRDQGVQMPGWMRDYPVKPCSIEPTTPAIVVEASRTQSGNVAEGIVERIQRQRIYGGVTLSPTDDVVTTIKAAPEAEALAAEVKQKVAASPILSPVSFERNGRQYKAIAIPGDETRDAGACRLTEADLVVPVLRDSRISLSRKFNSFFQPSDIFGKAWTMDLPHLEEQRRPVSRIGDDTKYEVVYQLTSPLNTYSETFIGRKYVSEAGAELIVPGTPDSVLLGIAEARDKRIGFTKEILFRDGQRWHFDDSGSLVSAERPPLAVVYRWNQGRVYRIEGWYGDRLYADIKLEYDEHSRLALARGSNNVAIKYIYDEAGMLIRLEGVYNTLEYRYRDDLVTEVIWNGKTIQHFEYNGRGQLLKQKRADGAEYVYSVSSEPDGIKVTASKTGMEEAEVTALYDQDFHPTGRVMRDGTRVQTQGNGSDGTETKITLPDGMEYSVSRSSDGETWKLPDGGTYHVEYDAGGRVISLQQGQSQVVRQQWREDGQLASVSFETAALHPEYREDGVMTNLVFTSPEGGAQSSRWLDVRYDDLGRTEKIADCSGSEISLSYDETGSLASLASNRDSVQLRRDNNGRLEALQTSWGYRQDNIYNSQNSELERVEFTQGNSKAALDFSQGALSKIQQFDGGEFKVTYYDQDAQKGQTKEIHTPNNLILTYEYDSENRIAAVNCGREYRLEYEYDSRGRLVTIRQVKANSGK